LIVRSGTKVNREAIESADTLKVIGRAGVGIDNIDLKAATQRGIMVMNAPTGNTISAAEHAVALMLSLARKIPQAHASLSKGKWEKKKFIGVEVFRKTLGVIGLGKVGSHVAKCALGLGMKVIGYDPFISREKAEKIGVESVELEELLKRSDFITLHVPLTPHTRYIIGEKEFALMKEGARIINCARGGVVDEQALYQAIESGKVAGAALDVFEKEPPENSSLLTLPQVIVTPHLGASTEEAQYNVAIEITQQIVDALKNRIYRNVINLPYVPQEEWYQIEPYLSLSEKMGSFVGQLCRGQIEELRLEFLGNMGISDYSLLVSGVLKGMFEVMQPGLITYVNAKMLAEERGIKIMERESGKSEDFNSLIIVEALTSAGKYSVSGTLLGREFPRLVKIDDYNIEIAPEGNILLCYNLDRPGLIGKIGKILGDANINIAQMNFYRKAKGGEAISILTLDVPPSDEVKAKLSGLEEVNRVESIIL
ncbi:MAG: phosphoglycerate dehydrogenase, partial [Caldiserica bacterium]|nr:phosphoglycerate dehydrogenase [Caldisericota bacterium]